MVRRCQYRRILSQILTDDERCSFDELPLGRVKWVSDLIEARILHETRKIIIGSTSAEEGSEQSKLNRDAVEQLSREIGDALRQRNK